MSGTAIFKTLHRSHAFINRETVLLVSKCHKPAGSGTGIIPKLKNEAPLKFLKAIIKLVA